ncbi:hypothetical protein COHA_004575 [Chlorella ohadii]|uniref:Uncharacterized protein n=1 Tax=Chlorella ohadii TaxID=2649997 RepID=A0AAD5DSL4_9CHLO|nr:hypothetical protein COHA_004575 [Chlorella ohadii]
MVQLPVGEDFQPTHYFCSKEFTQAHPHAQGTSCENLVALAGPLEQPQMAAPRVQQPAAGGPKPARSDPLEASLASPQGSASLDQYAPMLPSDPVQQLPLLPAPHTAATSRVAAWLLQHESEEATSANDAAGLSVPVEAAVPGQDDCDSGDDCADLALLHLHDSLDEAATEAARAGEDCDGYRPTSYYESQRRSLDGFMSQPVQHGDALNNFLAALY